jgi:hypothetical protein
LRAADIDTAFSTASYVIDSSVVFAFLMYSRDSSSKDFWATEFDFDAASDMYNKAYW